jgi:hypothetical protein
MARVLYGNTPADFTLSRSGKIVPDAPLTVWTDVSAGSQVTDLLDYANQPVATITSDDSGLVRFYGPDGTDSTLWIQSGSSTRLAVRPVNLPRPDLEIGTVTTGTADVTLTPNGLEGYTMDLVLPTAGANGVNTAAIQNDAVTADKIAANAVGASELADNAVDTAAIADSAVTSAKIADGTIATADIADGAVTAAKLGSDVRIGNLLTANQASVETDTTGLSAVGMTATRATDYALHGSASLRCEATGTGAINAGIPAGTSSAVPVTAGQTYTYTLSLRPINTQYFRLYVVYRGADGSTYVSESMGPTTVCADSTWTTLTYTHEAPAGAYYAHFWAYTDTSTVGQRFNLDCLGVWRGASGQWAMPGTVIPGTSHIADNGAFQTSGTAAPEGVITAPPLSRYLQTSGAATATGAMEWVKATGTGNTGWVAGAEADTGNRNLNAESWSNSWASYGSTGQRLRRVGGTVQLQLDVSKASASADAIYTLPSGFRPVSPVYVQCQTGTADDVAAVNIATNGAVTIVRSTANSNVIYGQAVFITADSWPASLPGTAA